MKMEQTQCSETSAIKYHAPENNQKCYTRHTEHGESLKSRTKQVSERRTKWINVLNSLKGYNTMILKHNYLSNHVIKRDIPQHVSGKPNLVMSLNAMS
jgi:hypothetical protein